jgi:hypothetical protein
VVSQERLKEGFMRSETGLPRRLRTITVARVALSANEVIHAQVNTAVVLGGVKHEAREGAGGAAAGGTLWKDGCEIVLSQAPGRSNEFLLFPSSLRQETE